MDQKIHFVGFKIIYKVSQFVTAEGQVNWKLVSTSHLSALFLFTRWGLKIWKISFLAANFDPNLI